MISIYAINFKIICLSKQDHVDWDLKKEIRKRNVITMQLVN